MHHSGWIRTEKSERDLVISRVIRAPRGGRLVGLDHGTEYTATAVHKDIADRNMHDEMGFQDGGRTVTRQLAELVDLNEA